ncbi:MAG: iron ABC transporter permease [Chloroflexi bacterium]|nr:iron ABC transporter permease [Chloroflexota bacterium]
MQRTLPITVTRALARPADKRAFTLPRFPSLLVVSATLILALVLLPLLYLALRAAGAGMAGVEYLLDGRTLAVIGNSLLLTGAVLLSSVLIGVPFAWLTARTDLPLRRFWLVAGLLPLVIPSYIGAIAYIAAFGPRGILQQTLEPFGVTSLPPLYGFFGAWLSITLFTYPYVVLPVRAALLNTDPALEECAHSLGLSRWTAFRRVTLPQLKPALAAGGLLAALYTLSDFGAVALMRFDAFTRVIYVQYTSSFDRSRAAILAVVLVLVTLALLALSRRLTAVQRNYRVGTGAGRQLRPVALGRWRVPALLFCAALVGVGTVVPVGVLASWVIGGQSLSINWHGAAVNTIGVSGLAAVAVALAALPLAWLGARAPSRAGRWLCELSYLGNGLPGLVIALALVFFTANAVPAIYQTLPVLILGYATRFLPLSVGATRSALTQINPRLEEAGRSLGLLPWQVMAKITVPLARAGILAGMALVFLSVMKELPTTLLLSPTGFNTFAMQIWTAQKEVNFAQTGAPALLLVAVSAVSLALILKRESH